jgi:PAS domain S-box-containing protein
MGTVPGLNRLGWSVGWIRRLRQSIGGLWLMAILSVYGAEEASTSFLTAVEQVRHLSATEAGQGRAVRIKGVVTLLDPGHYFFFVQDATGGIYVNHYNPAPPFGVGDAVEITAITGEGEFAPILRQPVIEVLGPAELPRALSRTLPELMRGTYDSQRVSVSGIVRGVGRHNGWIDLELVGPDGRFTAWVADPTNTPAPLELIDAHVKVRGVCGSLFNTKRQLTGVRLLAVSLAEIEVITPAPMAPFSQPVQAISSILKFTPQEGESHRIRIQGTVTLRRGEQGLFLEDDTGGIYVRTWGSPALNAGDGLDVVGFPVAATPQPFLEDAAVRVLGPGRPVAPTATTLAGLSERGFDSALVRVAGVLVDRLRRDRDYSLYVQDGGWIMEAILENTRDPGPLGNLQPGSWIEVVGVCATFPEQGQRKVSTVILLRSPADVRVLNAPPWWTLERTQRIVVLLLLITLASLLWVALLRRQVVRQTRIAQDSYQRIRQLYQAVEQSPATIVITNKEGDIEYVNPKFTELSGYSREEVMGKNPRILKSGEMTGDSYRQMWQTLCAGKDWRGEFHNRKKNGELYWEAAAISPVRDAAGQITHFLAVKEDITQRKFYEAEREKLIRELQEAMSKVKTLSGLLPICASCKKVRDDKGYWSQLEAYLGAHSDVLITHGICPDCMERLYPGFVPLVKPPASPAES